MAFLSFVKLLTYEAILDRSIAYIKCCLLFGAYMAPENRGLQTKLLTCSEDSKNQQMHSPYPNNAIKGGKFIYVAVLLEPDTPRVELYMQQVRFGEDRKTK